MILSYCSFLGQRILLLHGLGRKAAPGLAAPHRAVDMTTGVATPFQEGGRGVGAGAQAENEEQSIRRLNLTQDGRSGYLHDARSRPTR